MQKSNLELSEIRSARLFNCSGKCRDFTRPSSLKVTSHSE